ncbi:MAG TPA: PEP-utilizing enzyme, partial [Planctomycetota bacterium]|nr:PEP-utilizing enzyme [Planctomycetota bacterium]
MKGFLEVRGRGIAPGLACGPLRRNRPELSPKDAAGAILLAERAVPDDVPKILAAAGTLTFSGAVLSHVSLLCREFGKVSVSFAGLTPVRFAHEGEEGLLFVGARVLSDGDIVFLDGSRG